MKYIPQYIVIAVIMYWTLMILVPTYAPPPTDDYMHYLSGHAMHVPIEGHCMLVMHTRQHEATTIKVNDERCN